MNILVVSNLFPPHYLGGYELLCKGVCDDLHRRGHSITVLTTNHGLSTSADDGGEAENIIQSECMSQSESTVQPQNISESFPYKVHRTLNLYIPFGTAPSISRLKRHFIGLHNYRVTRKIIDQVKPDVIFVWSQLRLTLGSAYAATDSGIPVVYTYNDDHISGYRTPETGYSLLKAYRYIADCLLFPRNCVGGLDLSRSTAISRSVRDEITAKGVDVSAAEVIYQGIPIEQFPLKSNPGTVSKRVKILYAGQLHHYKGVHTIIEAAINLKRHNLFEFEVTIAGSGAPSYQKELEELIRVNDLSKEVIFAGKILREDMCKFYQENDIFIFPSIWKEPFGLTHLEAMACGTPVISTTCGGPGEFLIDGENSLTFEAEDAGNLADKVARLVQDPILRNKIVRIARETVEAKFTMTTYVNSLEEMLMKGCKNESHSYSKAVCAP
jgi:glycosyltransferase involved in cell wall biosynthesis